MQLYLLRHGDSQSDPSIADADRALTPSGMSSIQQVGRFLARMGVRFDAVYTSPLLRARQTAELAVTELQPPSVIQATEHLKVGGKLHGLFALLAEHPSTALVLLVGHEPYISQLISTLIVGNLDAKVDIRKASLSCVEVAGSVKPGAGTLKWVMPPQLLVP